MIALILLIPLLVALPIIALMRESKRIAYTAIAASIVSLALLPFVNLGTFSIDWFNVGGFEFSLVSSVSELNIVLLILVFLLAPFIYTYSLGYIKNRSEFKRYYIEMIAFTVAMASFAIAGNFILLFLAWEFLSITSYLLIGFWYRKRNASLAARKAVTIVFIGDISLLASIALFWNVYGTLTFSSINVAGGIASSAAVLLLIIAIFTKSAQFPFNEWLPDAMEGPVPVSAYLHSATMVKAGVFAAMVLFPIFAHTHTLIYFLTIGMLTAVIATTNAMREKHIKRVLAYSTVQELALMLSAIGVGALGAALYFFFAQAFYKALLFFSSGVMMDANESENIDSIYGLKKNKLVFLSTLFGVLALAGFIPFDGFFSSVMISSSFSTNLFAYIIISLISIATSFFIFRWFFAVSKDTKNRNIIASYRIQPRSMLISIASLAVILLIASIVFFYFGKFGYRLSLNLGEALIETVLVFIGFGISYAVYEKRKFSIKSNFLDKIVYNSVATNIFYNWFAEFIYKISEGIGIFDLYINDLFDWIGHIAVRLGDITRNLANGDISFYALIIVVSIIAIGALVLFV
jgi:NADH-quinone oxidoreductase subunit L